MESGGDPGLHGQRVRFQRQRQIAAKHCDQCAKERKDRHPEHHRSFVIAPDAGQPINQRHRRIGIFVDVENGKIGRDITFGKRAKSDCDEDELRKRDRRRHAHQYHIVGPRADDGHGRLDQREPEREHQGIVAEFSDHLFAPATGPSARCG